MDCIYVCICMYMSEIKKRKKRKNLAVLKTSRFHLEILLESGWGHLRTTNFDEID